MKWIFLLLTLLLIACTSTKPVIQAVGIPEEQQTIQQDSTIPQEIEETTTTVQSKKPYELATDACISLCQKEKEKGMDYSDGPCLSNQIIDDWVCDIAHSPRQSVDNDPNNQCPAFKEKKAHHFVELDDNCVTIKVY